MAGFEFYVDPSRCIGCRSCVAACAECDSHRGQSMIHVDFIDRKNTIATSPMVCMHCEEPACLAGCPSGAISKRDDGQKTELVLSITPRLVRNIRRPTVEETHFEIGPETALRPGAADLSYFTEVPAAPAGDTPALEALIANALGWDRSQAQEHNRLQARLRMGCVLAPGAQRVQDFQTAQLAKDDKGWTTWGTPEEIEKMRIAGRLAGEVLDYITPFVKPGVSTGELDTLCHRYMVEVQGCIPAPLPDSVANRCEHWTAPCARAWSASPMSS